MDGKVGSSGHSPVRQGQPDANARPGQRNSVANRLGPRVAEAAHHQAETKNSSSSAADVAPLVMHAPDTAWQTARNEAFQNLRLVEADFRQAGQTVVSFRPDIDAICNRLKTVMNDPHLTEADRAPLNEWLDTATLTALDGGATNYLGSVINAIMSSSATLQEKLHLVGWCAPAKMWMIEVKNEGQPTTLERAYPDTIRRHLEVLIHVEGLDDAKSARHVATGVDLQIRRLEGDHFICTAEQPNPALDSYFRGWVAGKPNYAIPPSELVRREGPGCVLS